MSGFDCTSHTATYLHHQYESTAVIEFGHKSKLESEFGCKLHSDMNSFLGLDLDLDHNHEIWFASRSGVAKGTAVLLFIGYPSGASNHWGAKSLSQEKVPYTTHQKELQHGEYPKWMYVSCIWSNAYFEVCFLSSQICKFLKLDWFFWMTNAAQTELWHQDVWPTLCDWSRSYIRVWIVRWFCESVPEMTAGYIVSISSQSQKSLTLRNPDIGDHFAESGVPFTRKSGLCDVCVRNITFWCHQECLIYIGIPFTYRSIYLIYQILTSHEQWQVDHNAAIKPECLKNFLNSAAHHNYAHKSMNVLWSCHVHPIVYHWLSELWVTYKHQAHLRARHHSECEMWPWRESIRFSTVWPSGLMFLVRQLIATVIIFVFVLTPEFRRNFGVTLLKMSAFVGFNSKTNGWVLQKLQALTFRHCISMIHLFKSP